MICRFYSYSFNVFRNTKEVINNNGLNAVTTNRITFTTEGVNSFQPWQWWRTNFSLRHLQILLHSQYEKIGEHHLKRTVSMHYRILLITRERNAQERVGRIMH